MYPANRFVCECDSVCLCAQGRFELLVKHEWCFSLIPTGTNLLIITIFWVWCAFFIFVDLTGRPAWVLKYKLQDAKQVPVGSTQQ